MFKPSPSSLHAASGLAHLLLHGFLLSGPFHSLMPKTVYLHGWRSPNRWVQQVSPMVSFRRTHYRISLRRFFTRGAYRQEGPIGQRDLLARGAYWPQGEALAPVASPLTTPLYSLIEHFLRCSRKLSWPMGIEPTYWKKLCSSFILALN